MKALLRLCRTRLRIGIPSTSEPWAISGDLASSHSWDERRNRQKLSREL
jgi:hypothetical protein